MKRRRTGRFQIRRKRSSGWSVIWRGSSPAGTEVLSASLLFLLVQLAVDFLVAFFHAGVPAVDTIVRGIVFLGRLGFFLVVSRLLLVGLLSRVECDERGNRGGEAGQKSEPGKT